MAVVPARLAGHLLQWSGGGDDRHVAEAHKPAYLAYLVGILQRRSEFVIEMELLAAIAHSISFFHI